MDSRNEPVTREAISRDFKGIWIPRKIWFDERLTALDKIILAEIDSLDAGEQGCYASNAHIASFCQCGERKVTEAISKLINLGYIYVKSFNGRERTLKSRVDFVSEADPQNQRESKIPRETESNIDENKDKGSSTILSKAQKELFDRFWAAYPRKVAKANAEKAWKKIGATPEITTLILIGISTAMKMDFRFRDAQYIPHPATWLNGREWENTYDEGRAENAGGNFKPSTGFRTDF